MAVRSTVRLTALATATAALTALSSASVGQAATCRPSTENRPVCPGKGAKETSNFVDPTVLVTRYRNVRLEGRVYVGPFAKLLGGRDAPITIGEESNAQDGVTITAAPDRGDNHPDFNDLDEDEGVEIGERVILAHGASVKGPAQLGVEGPDVAGNTDAKPEVFVSFGAQVDGAILERNTQVSALARVGPGVRLRSGHVVLAGKNVDSQAEADDLSLGKVRTITAADIMFAEAVIEVNVSLARQYSRLARKARSNVRGINYDPGNSSFNPERDLPRTRSQGLEPGTNPEGCIDGTPTRRPTFRNRIIGDVCLADPASRLSDVMGSQISLRADEGDPLGFGTIRRMGTGFISHALEETTVTVGDNVLYGRRAIVHGGGRRQDGRGRGTESTVVEDDVVLGDRSVTFRSLVGKGSTIGFKSAVVSSQLAPGTQIPDRVIYVNNTVAGSVEW